MLNSLLDKLNIDAVNREVLVAVLAFSLVMFAGTTILVLHDRRQRALRRMLAAGSRSVEPAAAGRLVRFLEKVGNFVSHGQASTNLWEQLVRAGFMGRNAPAVYTGVKILLFFVGFVVSVFLVARTEYPFTKQVWFVVIGAAVPFFLPNLVILSRERKRHQEIQAYLPDVVDLLEVCVTSGIGLDMAWNTVAGEIHHVSRVLGTAMDLSNFEMHLGANRTEAMRNMAARTGAEQLASLAAILVQSERFGTSVAAALREFAASMRDERRMTAEENAEKMAVKLIIPMVLCIFPAVIVVTVGPAAINIARTFLHQ